MVLSPFLKQCFVVLGVSLNLAQFGLVVGFAALLIPQLKAADSTITIDDTSGSWIASIPTLALIVGNVSVPSIMARYGRKRANLISIVLMSIGWICTTTATSIASLLIARFLQGASLGMAISLSSISIGEYTSPANRGAFLTILSLMMSAGTLLVHTAGSYLPWKMAALMCTCLTLADLFIVFLSPETPHWLANQGRYEECRVVFRWLRGDDEDDELNKMIEANIISRKSAVTQPADQDYDGLQTKVSDFLKTVKKREFYKPIIIVNHMYILGAVSGVNILAAYTIDVISDVTTDINMPLAVISLDVQRLITNTVAVYLIRKFKRRTVLFLTSSLNIISLFLIATYSYCNYLDIYRDTALGIFLIHLQMFSVAMGTLPLPFIIAGELFSLEHKSLSGGISSIFLSLIVFSTMKTFPFLKVSIGLYGTYALYGAFVTYSVIVLWFLLPETKDKTLRDIEIEFKSKELNFDDVKSSRRLITETHNTKIYVH